MRSFHLDKYPFELGVAGLDRRGDPASNRVASEARDSLSGDPPVSSGHKFGNAQYNFVDGIRSDSYPTQSGAGHLRRTLLSRQATVRLTLVATVL